MSSACPYPHGRSCPGAAAFDSDVGLDIVAASLHERRRGRQRARDRNRGKGITPTGGRARVLAVASDHANGAAGDVRSRGLDAIAGWRARLLEPSRKAAELTPPAFARVRCLSKRRPDCCGRLGTARAEPGAGHGGTIGIATDSWRSIWRSPREPKPGECESLSCTLCETRVGMRPLVVPWVLAVIATGCSR